MKKDTLKTCEYVDCNLPINEPHDSKFCIFHAPKENKGISTEEFNSKIFQEKINKNDFNFKGYVFPNEIIFPEDKELKDANFRDTRFLGYTVFKRVQFSGNAYFGGAQFSGDAYFRGAQFSRNVYFEGNQFFGDTDFREAQFSENADFREAQFSKAVYFIDNIIQVKISFENISLLKDSYFYLFCFDLVLNKIN